MISDRKDAHAAGAFNAPKNIKNGSVVEKLSQKKLGVGVYIGDTLYYRPPCLHTKMVYPGYITLVHSKRQKWYIQDIWL